VLKERGVFSCAELEGFYFYTDGNEACQLTRANSTTLTGELATGFFLAKQGAERKSRQSEIYITGDMHHRIPPSRTEWPGSNVVIFAIALHLVLDHPKQ
jgi:hypothetical protein